MADPRKTLVRRRETDERAERILVGALRGRGGAITRADAVALTGLPADQTESALRNLLARYRSHLAVTEQGELLYRFDPAMVRRSAVSLAERLDQAGQALWKGFTFFFKIWIVATLVIYTILFLVMMIALLFARSGDDRDDRRGGGFGIDPFLLWWLLPGPRFNDPHRPSHRRQLGGRQRGLPQKRFYQSVFDFVFGPRAEAEDPLGLDRELVAFIRGSAGRVSTTDLVALTGWSYERADQEMTRLLVDYDGQAEIRNDGTLIYVFPSLRATAGEVEHGRFQYAWGRERKLPALTGNTAGTNALVGGMNGFNLIASLAVAPAFALRFGLPADITAWLTAVPAAFSAVFYAVPGARALLRGRRERRMLAETARATVLAEIMEQAGRPATPEALVAAAGRRAALPPPLLRRALERLLLDLEGDVVNAEDGAVQYAFPRVSEELAAVRQARLEAPAAEQQVGAVVFSSAEEGSGELPALPETPSLRRLN